MKNIEDKYIKYKQKYILLKNNYNDIIKIKNGITMTLDNIYYFSNKSDCDKKYLYYFAKKHNHDDLQKILNKN